MTNDNIPPPTWACPDCRMDGGLGSLCRASDGAHTFELLTRAYLGEGDDRHRALDCVGDLVQAAPAQAVGFLIVACAQCASLPELCVIASGPLEDLLEAHGPLVIPHLEKIAKIDPRFRLMVSGIWNQARVDPDVWLRLVAAVAPGPVIDADERSPAARFAAKIATKAELAALFARPQSAPTKH